MSAFQKGIVYTSWWHGEYSSPESDLTLRHEIKPTGANWISVVVTCYQASITSTVIECKPTTLTPTDSDLAHVIQEAHRSGLRVMLKPHVDLAENARQWRGEIDFADDEAAWQAWFRSYTDFISHYAKIARDNDADYFVVGTELVKTSPRADDWRNIVKAVRKIYHGPLTYAAHFTYGETISWWDALDAIGIDAYYPLALGKNPTVEQIKTAWAPIVSRLGQLSGKWNRPVIFTEVGYQNLDGTNLTPWETTGTEVDFKGQANCYQAVFEAFEGQEWWHGVFWWAWKVHSDRSSALTADFTSHNKPAESILRQHYGGRLKLSPPMPPHPGGEGNHLMIYHDVLNAGWEDWSWNATVGLSADQDKQSENMALRVLISPGGALSLHHKGIDTSSYKWLEFYIYVGDNSKKQFVVSFNDASDHELSQKINLADSGYLEGGKFAAHQWQKVRIPIEKLAAGNAIITRLNIKDLSKQREKVFIDEISLTGEAAPKP